MSLTQVEAVNTLRSNWEQKGAIVGEYNDVVEFGDLLLGHFDAWVA